MLLSKEILMDIKVSLLPRVPAVKVLILIWYTLGNTSKNSYFAVQILSKQLHYH